MFYFLLTVFVKAFPYVFISTTQIVILGISLVYQFMDNYVAKVTV
jgi:hypothetical protein